MTHTKILFNLFSYFMNISNKIYFVEYTLEFCKKDLWIGIYWENEYDDDKLLERYWIPDYLIKKLDTYLCVIPMIVLHCALFEKIKNDDYEKNKKFIIKLRTAYWKIRGIKNEI